MECAWDAALSEVRVVFAFIAITITYLGYMAVEQSEKEKANIFIYAALLSAMLFVISGICDLSEIIGSKNDNENLCSLKGKYKVPEVVKVLFFECSYIRYYLTVALSIFCGGSLAAAAFLVRNWKRALNKPE